MRAPTNLMKAYKNQGPVEQRLNMINDIYKARREEQLKIKFDRQQAMVRSPEINAYSRQMANFHTQRANERLFEDHKRRQHNLAVKQKNLDKQLRMMSQPNLLASPKSPYSNFQKLSTTDGKQIVERLLGYKYRNFSKRNFVDPECTFKPKINKKSKRILQQSQRSHSRFRNSLDDKDCTFKPSVSERSKRIANSKNQYRAK